MKKITSLLFFLLTMISQLWSQNNVGIGTTTPDSSAILELQSNNQGFLMPRMSTSQRLSITQPANGLLVLDTTLQQFAYYNSSTSTWAFLDTIIANDPHNTLDQAYDQGGAGVGRKILVDAGAVNLEGNGTSDNLHISNSSNKIGIKITHVGTGKAIQASNSTNVLNAEDLIHSSSNGGSTTPITQDGGRAGHFKNSHSNNNKPALEASTLGTGHGLLGITGTFPPPLDPIPTAGVAGLSLSNNPRNGMTGISLTQNGVWGKTIDDNIWASDPSTTFNAGVMGVGADGFGITTGASAPFIGVAGMVKGGMGMLGLNLGNGHGVIGITKGTGSSTEAGVWGTIQESSWAAHSSEYPLYGDSAAGKAKGLVAILGQAKANPAIWGESQENIGLIGTTGAKKGKSEFPPLKAGLLANATQTDAMAAFFRTEGASIYPTMMTISKSSAAALKISNIGTGKGIHIAQKDTSTASSPNSTHALFAENHGMGICAEFRNEATSNPSSVLLSSTLGLGRAASFYTLRNPGNPSPTVDIINRGRGNGARIIIEDSISSPINPSAALLASTNGKGAGGIFDITNSHVSGGNENTEPAILAQTKGMGFAGYFKLDNASNTSPAVFVEHKGLGHGFSVESSNGAASALIHANQSGIGSSAAKGYAAHFENSSTAASPSKQVVLISSKNPTPPSVPSTVTGIGATYFPHAALRVLPASSVHAAATFEGHVDISSKLIVGGEILSPSIKVGALSIVGGMTAGGAIVGTGPVTGTFKAFRIDHPLDPQNKYMYHASIESNEFMNIYSGNITTDQQGLATVQLPHWMTALNGNFRYQLTVVGKTFSKAIVWEEINKNGQFTIKTEEPDIQVSWQVSGIRQDVYAKENPLQVEVEKEAAMKGQLIYEPKEQ